MSFTNNTIYYYIILTVCFTFTYQVVVNILIETTKTYFIKNCNDQYYNYILTHQTIILLIVNLCVFVYDMILAHRKINNIQ